MRSITFTHLHHHAKKFENEITSVIRQVIASGIFLEGPQVKKLEHALKQYLGTGHVITVSSGHDALSLALASLKLGHDDEVIIPANTYPTAFPVLMSGAKLRLADVDQNGQLDADSLLKHISGNTKAIIVVHLFGLTGDVRKIKKIARGKKIVLIEDCAQAFGTTFRGKPVGTFGDIGCFSFYPTKNIGTLGDGGAIWTKRKRIYQYVKQAKSYGETKRYMSKFPAGHSRIPEIQAGIINVYFSSHPQDQLNKEQVFAWYCKIMNQLKLSKRVRVLRSHPRSRPHHHLFVIEADRRDALRQYLDQEGIHTAVHYPISIHRLPFVRPTMKERFPMSEKLSRRILSLPFHHYLTREDVLFICSKIKGFYG